MQAQKADAMLTFEAGADAFHNQDHEGALKAWTKAAENGDVESLFNLGLMYANGNGVERDWKAARDWFMTVCVASKTTYPPLHLIFT